MTTSLPLLCSFRFFPHLLVVARSIAICVSHRRCSCWIFCMRSSYWIGDRQWCGCPIDWMERELTVASENNDIKYIIFFFRSTFTCISHHHQPLSVATPSICSSSKHTHHKFGRWTSLRIHVITSYVISCPGSIITRVSVMLLLSCRLFALTTPTNIYRNNQQFIFTHVYNTKFCIHKQRARGVTFTLRPALFGD